MAHDKIDIVFFGAMAVFIVSITWGAISSTMDVNEFTEACNNKNGVAVMTTTGIACVDKNVILR